MVHNELSDDIEKKAWAICSPMYQHSGQLLSNEFIFAVCLITTKLKILELLVS